MLHPHIPKKLNNYMMSKILILFLLFCFTSYSQVKPENNVYITKFIKLIKLNDIEGISELIRFPLNREYPIPPVKTKSDFVKRFDEIFDNHLKNEILSSTIKDNWSEVGWRGIMLNQGTLWLDYDGSLIAINYQTIYEKELLSSIISAQKKKLHESIKKFSKSILELETEKYKIRIDEISESNYRYSAWSKDKEMSDKPNIIIQNGKLEVDGSGGNHRYIFKNKEYTYECSIIVLGEEESPPAILTVYKNENEILKQNATKLID